MFKLKDECALAKSFAKSMTLLYCKENNIYDLFLHRVNIQFFYNIDFYDVNNSINWFNQPESHILWYRHFIRYSIFYNNHIKKYNQLIHFMYLPDLTQIYNDNINDIKLICNREIQCPFLKSCI